MDKLSRRQRKQRAERGWCDGDAWNAGFYLADVGQGLLRKMRKDGIGFPIALNSREEWEAILSEIELGFSALSQDLPYDDIKTVDLQAWQAARQVEWSRACELLAEWGFNLWD